MSVWTKIKIGAVILALLIMAGLCIYAAGLRSDRDRLARDLDAARQESAGMALELKANRLALADRAAEMERLANEYAALAATLEEVYRNDPEANAWADALCPVSVLDCLR